MSFAETELGDGSFFQAQAVLSSRIGSGGLGGGHLNELIFGTAAGQNSKNESSIVLSLAVPPNCFCSDPQGWGPFDGEYRFTSCFIDGVVLQFPNILLLIVGLYQIYVFSQRKPRVGTMKWNGWLKMVSIHTKCIKVLKPSDLSVLGSSERLEIPAVRGNVKFSLCELP